MSAGVVAINNPKDAEKLRSVGYKWSGHTHPGFTDASLIVSDGDRRVLQAFRQSSSILYNAAGSFEMVTLRED